VAGSNLSPLDEAVSGSRRAISGGDQLLHQFGQEVCAAACWPYTYGPSTKTKESFKAAGDRRPAEDDAELTADAKKLTKFTPLTGRSRFPRLRPFIGVYANTPGTLGELAVGAKLASTRSEH